MPGSSELALLVAKDASLFALPAPRAQERRFGGLANNGSSLCKLPAFFIRPRTARKTLRPQGPP